jgi:oxygen-independent coproporphyrinogen-3 oxidase
MPYGLYIHLPFCRRKCPYCAFASVAGAEDLLDTYADAVVRELDLRRNGVFSGPPQTIYIGGGTPSIAPAPLIGRITEGLVDLAPEFTVEANPDSLSAGWLDGMLAAGANRLSIGIQALDDRLLAALGRLHTADQAIRSVRLARQAGFRNVSVDLMFGIPGQTIGQWKRTLNGVLALEIEHISSYSLSVEEDTPFFKTAEKGGLDAPDPSETADMYEMMSEAFERSGFVRYELSNFARPEYECRHNMGYWNFTPYLGVGSGAHSFDGALRRWNEPDPRRYCEMSGEGRDPVAGMEALDRSKRALEHLMLAMRTAEGLHIEEFLSRYPADRSGMLSKVENLTRKGFLDERGDGNVVLTIQGAMIADEILIELAAYLP